MRDEPIFIVGVQRSGTTLLAAMLAAHSRLSCGPETHFFRQLARVDALSLCDEATWPEAALAFISAIDHTGFVSQERTTLLAKYQLQTDEVAAYLRAQRPSIAAILSSVTGLYMTARQKMRWVEKTPDHILHAATIRRHFPNSPIIRIVRDPRDVALSLLKVPWGVSSFVEGLMYWDRMDQRSRGFFAADALSLTVRFEDLIEDPTATLQKVCGFIGESFECGMLNTSSTGAAINSRQVPWKDKVSQALDARRAGAWRAELAPRDNQLAESLLGDRMEAFGYPQEGVFTRLGEIRPGLAAAARYADGLGVLASQGIRFWRATEAEVATATVYVGDPGYRAAPGSTDWGGEEIHALPLVAQIVKARLFGGRVYWIAGDEAEQWSGYRSHLLKKWLSPFRVCGVGPSRASENLHRVS